MLSPVMEDYLKAIYQLGDDKVRTSELAEYLGVSQPTVTNTLEKLDERGLVEREKYKGVELTEEGKTVAVEVVRHHRLIEAYLAEALDYDWSEVHDEAERLEHHISEEFEERVADALDNPERDPHGAPIPSESLEPPEEGGETLDTHSEGDEVVVESVEDDDAEVLEYLEENGVVPDANVAVVEVAPFGMVTVRVDGNEVALPNEVARRVRVRPTAKQVDV
ncbi:MAG: metal-dependent transcriptional regulator [Halobacteriales archaeon]|nr:metal-dependent transcriptional regulator [Halobacteriales archaeon]